MAKVSDKPARDFISMVGEREHELQQRIAELEEALQEFINHVDAGRVRSVRTYAKYKRLLGQSVKEKS